MHDKVREALESARHTLTTHHGLWATDQSNVARDALSDGCDINGALDVYDEMKFQLDTTADIARIDVALAGLAHGQEE
ncbi:MAG: hypothetical protein M3R24_30455 [Chloroflexota bacterium]|nr:hypothetical protein [Chloroflexota bacterium]